MKAYKVYHIFNFIIYELLEAESFYLPCRVLVTKCDGTKYRLKFGDNNLLAVRQMFDKLFDMNSSQFINRQMLIDGNNPIFYSFFGFQEYEFYMDNDHYQLYIEITGLRYNNKNGEVTPLWDIQEMQHRENNRMHCEYYDSDTI